MFKKIALAAALGVSALNAQAATVSYGWEDGVGTVLGEFGTGMQYSNTDALAHSGSRSLLIEDIDNTSGTPQGYLAWITGLADGDTVDASFWAFDNTPSAAPSVRIWGHYTSGSDVNSYAGSADGNTTYSGSTDWSQLSHNWVFDSDGGTRDGLVVEVRFYDSSSVPTGSALVDDLYVSSSSGEISVPGTSAVPLPGAMWLLGSGLIGLTSLIRKRGTRA